MRTIIYLTAFLITSICIQPVKQKHFIIQIKGFNRKTWGNSTDVMGSQRNEYGRLHKETLRISA